MNSSDQMDFSINSSDYVYWTECKGENSTLHSADVIKILSLPSFQLAFIISKVLIVACFCMTFIVGVLGNGLVIYIAGFKMKTVSAVWFVNLAIVDFMFCFTLPIRVTVSVMSPHDISILTILNFVFLYINSIISVLFLTVISIDRCVTIMWPLWAKVHRTRRLANICSLFIWTVPPFITITCILTLDFDIHAFYVFVPTYYYVSYYCLIENSSFRKHLMISRSLIMFGLSLAVMLFCYSLIIFKLRSNTIKRPKKFNRTFRIIIGVVVCFFASWFPYNVWPFVAKNETMYQVLTDIIVSSLCLCLVAISSCLNPILYVLLVKGGSYNWRKSIRCRLENAMNELK